MDSPYTAQSKSNGSGCVEMQAKLDKLLALFCLSQIAIDFKVVRTALKATCIKQLPVHKSQFMESFVEIYLYKASSCLKQSIFAFPKCLLNTGSTVPFFTLDWFHILLHRIYIMYYADILIRLLYS